MKAPSYVCLSRNGVYYARFVLPQYFLDPVQSTVRDIRISTLTKDPRDALRRARMLRLKMDMLLYSYTGTSRTDFISQLQRVMSQFKRPPPGVMSFMLN